MEKMTNLSTWWFSLGWRIQKWLMEKKAEDSPVFKRAGIVSVLCFLATILLVFLPVFGMFRLFLMLILLFASFLSWYIAKSFETLTTARGFFGNGLLFTFVISVFLLPLGSSTEQLVNQYVENEGLQFALVYIFICLCFILPWVFISNLANAKVSSMVNAILTTLLTVAIHAVNGMIDALPSNYIFSSPQQTQQLLDGGYTAPQMFKIIFALLITPLLLMLAAATIAGVMKMYWIDKYNGGKDISSIHQKQTESV